MLCMTQLILVDYLILLVALSYSLLLFSHSSLIGPTTVSSSYYSTPTVLFRPTVILARLTIDSISLSFTLFFFLFGNYVALAFFLSSSSVFGPINSDKLLARSIPLQVATPHFGDESS